MNPGRFKNALIHLCLEYLVAVGRALSPWAARTVGEALGWLAFLLLARHREKAVGQLLECYEQVLGLPSDVPALRRRRARAAAASLFCNLGRWSAELCSFVDRPEQIGRRVEIPARSLRVLERARKDGHGVLFLTGHFGNWELVAWAMAAAGYRACAVGRRSYHDGITDLVHHLRERAGVHVMYREDPGLARELLGALHSGSLVGILVDPSTDMPSRDVPFLGRPAPTMEAPARLALRRSGSVVFGWCLEGPGGKLVVEVWPFDLDRGVSLENAMRAINLHVERAVIARPDHWIWMHPRWEPRRR